MYLTILRLIWPYVMRYGASKTADYLQQRRERQLNLTAKAETGEECPPCPPCPPSSTDSPAAKAGRVPTELKTSSMSNPIWFALSGLLLGCAFSIIIYIFLQDKDKHP